MQPAGDVVTAMQQLRRIFAATARVQLPPVALPAAALEACRAALDLSLAVVPLRLALSEQKLLQVRSAPVHLLIPILCPQTPALCKKARNTDLSIGVAATRAWSIIEYPEQVCHH